MSLTDLTGSGWSLTANVNDGDGRATLSVWSTAALPGDPGDLLDLAFQVPGDGNRARLWWTWAASSTRASSR